MKETSIVNKYTKHWLHNYWWVRDAKPQNICGQPEGSKQCMEDIQAGIKLRSTKTFKKSKVTCKSGGSCSDREPTKYVQGK